MFPIWEGYYLRSFRQSVQRPLELKYLIQFIGWLYLSQNWF